jgi:hypothetical protein
MKRQPIEVYGFGRRLPTRTDRITVALLPAGMIAVIAWLVWTLLEAAW